MFEPLPRALLNADFVGGLNWGEDGARSLGIAEPTLIFSINGVSVYAPSTLCTIVVSVRHDAK